MARRRPSDAPATEAVNPRTRDLDRLDTSEMLARILAEDAGVPAAVLAALPALTRACDVLTDVLAGGGRWFNVGAGTSGRIGQLDAAEIPPTFGIPPDRVQAILAGGPDAAHRAVEGAEDDVAAAARDLDARGLGPADAVVALSASGRTPYTVAAARHAAQRGARTVGVTCAAGSPLTECVAVPVVVEVGPEAIAGSTRLKGGLAEKMVLHALSTSVMVRLGHVRGNLMTGLRAVNRKLEGRALRILAELTGCTPEAARAALEAAEGRVADALERLRGG